MQFSTSSTSPQSYSLKGFPWFNLDTMSAYQVAAFSGANRVTAGTLSTPFSDLQSAERYVRELVESGEYSESDIHIFSV